MIKKVIYFIVTLCSFGCLNSSNSAKDNKHLNQFLQEQELDNLLNLHSTVSIKNKEDSTLILSILDNWNDKQAVSNLLFYPTLIPQANRFNAVVKGLTDQKNKYFNLASIVGVQSPEDLGFNNDEVSRIKNILFKHVEQSMDSRAMRSTTSLAQYINKDDTESILTCASNTMEDVQTNLLSMISNLYGQNNIRNVLMEKNSENKIGSENLLAELEKQELKIKEAPEDKKGFFKSIVGMPVAGYIPNLVEFK